MFDMATDALFVMRLIWSAERVGVAAGMVSDAQAAAAPAPADALEPHFSTAAAPAPSMLLSLPEQLQSIQEAADLNVLLGGIAGSCILLRCEPVVIRHVTRHAWLGSSVVFEDPGVLTLGVYTNGASQPGQGPRTSAACGRIMLRAQSDHNVESPLHLLSQLSPGIHKIPSLVNSMYVWCERVCCSRR